MKGFYIDSEWFNKTLSILNMESKDLKRFEDLVIYFNDSERDLFVD